MAKVQKIKNNNKQKSSDIRQEIRHLGVIIENVNDGVKLIAEQHGDIKKTLDSHTDMIGKLAVDLTIVKEDIAFIKGTLKKKVDYEEFAVLERRVALLEKRR